ncbi:MAG: hypothetical protein Ta2B_16820 [Termitinemataceae bacterium]|nr:MAG: hypothetical protein Ta2B_16820 [Termitinemataceae bacterium]
MDFSKIKVIKSKGNSGAVINLTDNILVPNTIIWPTLEIVQKLYQSNHLKDFNEEYHGILTKELGYYCDLYSIKSEDSITWSLFGYISKLEYSIKNNFYNEFLKNIKVKEDKIISIELWKRIPHPETKVSGGPEIDVILNGEKYCILIEVKWTSGIDKKQGKNKNKTQIELRNMFCNGIGKKIFKTKKCITVVVANENTENELFLSWDKLSDFETLPHKKLFKEYLKWKKSYI